MPGIPEKDFRPPSYFGPQPLATQLLSTVKGELRQQEIREAAEGGTLDQVPEWMRFESLPDDVRRMTGRAHPAFMGGEYLSSLEESEVEIARIVFGSVTRDVTSVRARWDVVERFICYSVVDENEGDFNCRPATSKVPLTMGQLVRLIEGCRKPSLILGTIRDNLKWGSDWISMWGFVKVSSAFYPALGPYYDQRIEAWLEARRPRDAR